MTKLDFFHHPDYSLPVIRRRAAGELIDLLAAYGQFAFPYATHPPWSQCFPSQTAYRMALWRLQKAGVVAYRRKKDGTRFLSLQTPESHSLVDPLKRWDARWDGIWRLLVYDIPEEERSFRTSFARLLHRLRLGCLQQSVWITPRDIRPDYDDLVQTVGLEYVSYLFEARTVLGRKAEDIVRTAWAWEDISSQQRWFMDSCRRAADLVLAKDTDPQTLETLVREELTAYIAAMERDPLLPRALLPYEYLGIQAHESHTAFIQTVKNRVQTG